MPISLMKPWSNRNSDNLSSAGSSPSREPSREPTRRNSITSTGTIKWKSKSTLIKGFNALKTKTYDIGDSSESIFSNFKSSISLKQLDDSTTYEEHNGIPKTYSDWELNKHLNKKSSYRERKRSLKQTHAPEPPKNPINGNPASINHITESNGDLLNAYHNDLFRESSLTKRKKGNQPPKKPARRSIESSPNSQDHQINGLISDFSISIDDETKSSCEQISTSFAKHKRKPALGSIESSPNLPDHQTNGLISDFSFSLDEETKSSSETISSSFAKHKKNSSFRKLRPMRSISYTCGLGDEEHDRIVSANSAESPKNTPDLLLQISELQEAVVEMKSSLTEAVTRLGSVVEEPLVAREVNEARTRCDNNTSEVLKLVLSLKTDITQLQTSVSAVADRQESLQNTVQTLLDDRRLLLQDLTQAGVVSLHTRSRLESGNILGIDDGGRAPIRGSQGSGSHSNDSGVALLLERAHHAFTADNNASPTPTNNRTSDQDSLPEQPSLLVPPSVYEYVAGLRNPATHSTPNSHAKNTHQDNTQNKSSLGEDSGCVVGGGDSEDLGLTYDSDSSLTIAANKTISLSASLSQQCGIELRTASTTADSRHNHGHHRNNRSAVPSMHNRSDSDGSDQSREAARHRHKRRSHEHVESADPYTMVVTRSRPSTIDPREAQRYRVARELLDTEKKYCKTLWTIQDTFADPLKKAGILSHKDITTLFPEEVYQLYDKHCLLQHQLKERLASWKWQPMVGDIVARFTDPRHTDVLRLYTAYVNDFPEVLKTFHKLCRTSPPFTKFIKSCLEQPACGGLDLGAFLLTPVQRVPRYILLMKNLLKYTDPGHPDYQHLHACLERLRDFLARLNDSMEHSFQLVHAQLSHMTPGKNHHHSSAPNTVQRPSRSPRRSCSSISSPPVSPSSPSYSPDRSLCRSQTTSPERRQHSPSCSQKSFSSPHRSHSLAASQPPSCRPRSVLTDDNRSSSLPRGSASSDSSRTSNSPHSDISRVRSRSESVASRRPLSAHQNCKLVNSQDAPRGTLVPAHSIADVSIHENNETTRWEDLRASEPSLVDSGRPSKKSPKHDSKPINLRPLTASHSAHNMSDSQQKIVSPSWCETSPGDDLRNKKKPSIRTSIKNMFTFKKRYVNSSYWNTRPIPDWYHKHGLAPPVTAFHKGKTRSLGRTFSLTKADLPRLPTLNDSDSTVTSRPSFCVLHESSV